MKKTILFTLLLVTVTLTAQISFTNESSKLGEFDGVGSQLAVDMNGDFLDDYARVSENGIFVDYQQEDGTFNSVMYDMPIQNVPNWSIAAGDLDENGFNDMVLGNGSFVSFVMNRSTGTGFTEVPFSEGIFSQRSTMADIDNDGDLDAFVCHDLALSHPYRNDGDGNMTLDQTLIETIAAPGNYAAIWVDYDNDGDQDMYITKCKGGEPVGHPHNENAMYTNDGNGVFTENALSIGLQDSARSWATVFEDFDNDGDFDAFIVNHNGANTFFENDGNGNFTNIIETTGINSADLGAWENQAADFNNDGFVDIFSELSKELYINNGDMTFTGMDLDFDEGAISDMNNDGHLDVLVQGQLFTNNGNDNNWVKMGLVGVESNLNGIGARVEIYGEWGIQIRELRSGQGFSHMNSLNVHFGIGESENIDSIIVRWPSGMVDEFLSPEINTHHILEEGSSPLAITDFEREGINLYPNPAVEIVNFSLKGLANTPVTIIDSNGRHVRSTLISSNNDINISSLSSGIYFLRLKVENKLVNYKFIKK
ncbi:FG-GAP-like repeat-containing protein [Cochleicola gelatinilyticus]|uniref:RNA-binding protein n=1 Tax=Cochleicola gelatinilyticus TaxID=1763537 RepID=A0A167IH43_9FLAO|nr:FG-GAP-like repeat-containing protein [Cochleicola gelatinilyticus]OAB79645.1 hypothetical protein ULVI_02510 [Cochleicola gelatinilyticus]